jgi:hypothetical protein
MKLLLMLFLSNHTAQLEITFPCMLLNMKHKKNISNNNHEDFMSWAIFDKTNTVSVAYKQSVYWNDEHTHKHDFLHIHMLCAKNIQQ